jgi:MinD-like ATPase involved in chromosome partitioning or flagellar assembly
MECVSRKFLGRAARFIGWVPEDPAVQAAVNARAPVLRHAPESPAARALQRLGLVVSQDLGCHTPRGLGRGLLRTAGYSPALD